MFSLRAQQSAFHVNCSTYRSEGALCKDSLESRQERLAIDVGRQEAQCDCVVEKASDIPTVHRYLLDSQMTLH